MTTFSIGGAVGSGFRVIGRNPVAVLIWGLTYFAVALAPILAVVALAAPDFMNLSKLAAESAGAGGSAAAPPMGPILALQSKMMLLQAVQFISTIAAAAILYGAVFRAVLEPQEKRRWYLRLGQQEAWIAFVWAVTMVLAMIAMFAGMIPLGILGMIIGVVTKGGDPASWSILAVFGLGLLGVLLWGWARLSLALPMTFSERNFRLFESWELTRGHAVRIILTFLAVVVLMLVIEVLVFGGAAVLGVVGLAASGVTGPWSEGADATMPAPPGGWPAFLLVAIPCAALLLSVVMAALQTIMIAPIAYIYRELAAAKALTAPGT